MPQHQYEAFCSPLNTYYCYNVTPGLILKLIHFRGHFPALRTIATPYLRDIVTITPDIVIQLSPEEMELGRRSFLQRDSLSASSWGLDRIGGRGRGGFEGAGVSIFILDTGVRTTHTDFGGRAIQ